MRRIAFSLLGLAFIALGLLWGLVSALNGAALLPPAGLALAGAVSYAAAWFMPVFTYPHNPRKGRRRARAGLPKALRWAITMPCEGPRIAVQTPSGV